MKGKSGAQVWAEYIAMRGLLGMLGMSPRAIAYSLGRGVSRAAFRILASRLESGMRSLELAFPEMAEQERKRVLRASVESIGRTVVEFAKYRPASSEESRSVIEFDFKAPEFGAYTNAKSEGRGVIMTTAHIGNWEVLL